MAKDAAAKLAKLAGDETGRIIPGPPPHNPNDVNALDVWGFTDSGFEATADGQVRVKGTRYAAGGDVLPNLLPWVSGVMEADIRVEDSFPSQYPREIAKAKANKAFQKAIADFLNADQISDDDLLRQRHGHGQTQEEMFAIKYGSLGRIPDLIVYPESEQQVEQLVQAAVKHNVCLIPYGGGTNVTDALRCPADEKRCIVSVDLERLNRILWIDPVDQTACIQAGAIGRHIMSQLAEHGYTLGHEPDSVEFSTLGGWIATNASGMKKNRYGNIEQVVLDFNLVGVDGVLSRKDMNPRESVGADPRRWVFGSEGNVGIITSAIVKVFPLPEVQEYGSVLFKNFAAGAAFMYDLTREGKQPASVRLVDNMQFQFSMALKPASQGLKKLKSSLEKLLVTKALGYSPEQMVACTLVFEGSKADVQVQQEAVYRLAKTHGGMKAGGDNGKRGYELTFAIAYIRDFIMNHYIIAESFETSVPWSQVLSLVEQVKQRLFDECAARGVPGKPYVTARITQVYDSGCVVYFYFAFYFKGMDDPSGVYAEIEHAARDEVLKAGGSLSHHHGIGKLRSEFLPRIQSAATLSWNQQMKQAVDPKNIFGSRNHVPPKSA